MSAGKSSGASSVRRHNGHQAMLCHRAVHTHLACLPGCDRVLRLASRRSSFPSMGDYVQKNRPNWRMPLRSGRRKGDKTIKPPVPNGYGFRSVTRPCKAVARSTGKRCKKPAMHGSPCCEKHGGHCACLPQRDGASWAEACDIAGGRPGGPTQGAGDDRLRRDTAGYAARRRVAGIADRSWQAV